jgi:citrate synthase
MNRESTPEFRADLLSAKQALEILEIKPQTLYAYVTRGWIRAISQRNTRAKLYSRDDIERMRMRSLARAGHGPAAASAMHWGEPVMVSSITEITPEGPRYRGRLATELARMSLPFETTADILWTGVSDEATIGWKFDAPPADFHKVANELARRVPGMRFRHLFGVLVQLLAAAQDGNPEATVGATVPAARQLMHVLAGAFAHLRGRPFVVSTSGRSIADTLARSLRIKLDAEGYAGLNAALTLAADHELAPSTFAARIAASTGATLHACVVSGITAFDGALTGFGADQTEDLVDSARTKPELRKRLRILRDEGKRLPGFNHPLYPKGDPRALYLIDAVRGMKRAAPRAQMLLEFINEAEQDFQAYPSLPVGLVALQLAMDLPPRTAGALFLLGRIAGWIAHVQEQRLAGVLLRPRAKYSP